MKITVVGHTLEGLTMASCLAEIGNNVYLTPMDEQEFSDNLFEHPSMQDGGLHSVFKMQIDEKRGLRSNRTSLLRGQDDPVLNRDRASSRIRCPRWRITGTA